MKTNIALNLILYICPSICKRAMSLRGESNLYVSKRADRLVLLPGSDNFNGQSVMIHNRNLYIREKNKLYTLGLNPKQIEISLIEESIENISKMSFLTAKNNKVVDLFHIDTKGNDQNNVAEHKDNQATYGNSDMPHTGKQSAIPKERRVDRKFRFGEEKTGSSREPKRVFNRPKMLGKPQHVVVEEHCSDINTISETKEIKPVPKRETLQVEVTKKKKPHPEYLVESDSTMDEENHLVVSGVKIEEIDETYFLLKGSNGSCVTYFHTKFIFVPCTGSEIQQFCLTKIEDLLKTRTKLHYNEISAEKESVSNRKSDIYVEKDTRNDKKIQEMEYTSDQSERQKDDTRDTGSKFSQFRFNTTEDMRLNENLVRDQYENYKSRGRMPSFYNTSNVNVGDNNRKFGGVTSSIYPKNFIEGVEIEKSIDNASAVEPGAVKRFSGLEDNRDDLQLPINDNRDDLQLPINENRDNLQLPIIANRNNLHLPINANRNNLHLPINANRNNLQLPIYANRNNLQLPINANRNNLQPSIDENKSNGYREYSKSFDIDKDSKDSIFEKLTDGI